MGCNKGNYAIGALIALGLYFVCSFLTAFLNVMVAFTAGYDSFAAFQDAAESVSGIIIVLVIGIASHLFFFMAYRKGDVSLRKKETVLDQRLLPDSGYCDLYFCFSNSPRFHRFTCRLDYLYDPCSGN